MFFGFFFKIVLMILFQPLNRIIKNNFHCKIFIEISVIFIYTGCLTPTHFFGNPKYEKMFCAELI